MTAHFRVAFSALILPGLCFSLATPALAQAPQAVPPAAEARPAAPAADASLVPLMVRVTISRYQNDKRTSSLPFSLWMNANEARDATLNAGLQVPIASGSGANATVSYSNVGTRISGRAFRMPDGRFQVTLTVSDSSAVPAAQGNSSNPVYSPMLTSLSAENRILVRDGQTVEVLTTTDKITGEVTKVEVMVTVLK